MGCGTSGLKHAAGANKNRYESNQLGVATLTVNQAEAKAKSPQRPASQKTSPSFTGEQDGAPQSQISRDSPQVESGDAVGDRPEWDGHSGSESGDRSSQSRRGDGAPERQDAHRKVSGSLGHEESVAIGPMSPLDVLSFGGPTIGEAPSEGRAALEVDGRQGRGDVADVVNRVHTDLQGAGQSGRRDGGDSDVMGQTGKGTGDRSSWIGPSEDQSQACSSAAVSVAAVVRGGDAAGTSAGGCASAPASETTGSVPLVATLDGRDKGKDKDKDEAGAGALDEGEVEGKEQMGRLQDRPGGCTSASGVFSTAQHEQGASAASEETRSEPGVAISADSCATVEPAPLDEGTEGSEGHEERHNDGNRTTGSTMVSNRLMNRSSSGACSSSPSPAGPRAAHCENVDAVRPLAGPKAAQGESVEAAGCSSSPSPAGPKAARSESVEAARRSGTVVVFFSSTFRDFQAERNELNAWAIPRLRRMCLERALAFIPVDLRWGVTKEEAVDGEVLKLCLTEVSRSTYFIGMYGDRYGWHQPDPSHPDSLLSATFDRAQLSFPWINAYRDRSVTELEFRHGALNNLEHTRTTSSFYFRSSAYTEAQPESERHVFECESPLARAKLDQLKDEVKNAGLKVLDSYDSVTEVVGCIFEDLRCFLDRDFPPNIPTDILTRERCEHEAFLENRCRIYLPRPGVLDDLSARADHMQSIPLCVVGQSGCGKTALLSNWVRQRRHDRPHEFLFLHFIGSSNDSSYPSSILRRLLREFAHSGSSMASSLLSTATDDASLTAFFKSSLGSIQSELKKPVLIVLDGLDQVVGNDLAWLVSNTSPLVRLLCSCTEGWALDHVQQLGWAVHSVPMLSPNERRSVAISYLSVFGRKLGDQQLELVEGCHRCQNVLFLRLLLDELMAQGAFEDLPAKLNLLLSSESIATLYEHILGRLEKHHPALKDLLPFLHCARYGLSEDECRAFAGLDDKESRRGWLQLYAMLRDFLVAKRGLLTFFHKSFAEAVTRRYDLGRRAAEVHGRLGELFAQCGTEDRIQQERPWHLLRAKRHSELEALLVDVGTAVAIFRNEKYQMMRYWVSIGTDPRLAYGRQVGWLVEDEGRVRDFGVAFGALLWEFGAYSQACVLQERVVAVLHRELGEEHVETLAAMLGLAVSLDKLGRYDEGRVLKEKVVAVRERVLGLEHPATLAVMSNLAWGLRETGQYDEATAMYGRVLELRERVCGPEHPDTLTTLGNLACTYDRAGRHGEAKELQQRVLEMRRKVLGGEHPDTFTAMYNLAITLGNLGELVAARTLGELAVQLRERALGPDHPDTINAIDQLAAMLDREGRDVEAVVLKERVVKVRERLLGVRHPGTMQAAKELEAMLGKLGRDNEARELRLRFGTGAGAG